MPIMHVDFKQTVPLPQLQMIRIFCKAAPHHNSAWQSSTQLTTASEMESATEPGMHWVLVDRYEGSPVTPAQMGMPSVLYEET